MKRIETELSGVVILEPKVFGDHRGFFFEPYNRRTFEVLGITVEFVQDNHSRSARNVLRGLHYQREPAAQDKLLRVTSGAVFDVVVDIRRGSPTFGRWVGVELSEENKRLIFVPKGFAHGFYVVSERADVEYKCSSFYAPPEERGVAWNDPDVGVRWPIPEGIAPLLSAKDAAYARLEDAREADLPVFDPRARGAPA